MIALATLTPDVRPSSPLYDWPRSGAGGCADFRESPARRNGVVSGRPARAGGPVRGGGDFGPAPAAACRRRDAGRAVGDLVAATESSPREPGRRLPAAFPGEHDRGLGRRPPGAGAGRAGVSRDLD